MHRSPRALLRRPLVRLALLAVALGVAACEAAYVDSSPASRASGAPGGALPAVDEEIWVIARPERDGPWVDARPEPAGLFLVDGEREVPAPLDHTSVRAAITGFVASVDVEQRYRNPFGTMIEAVYRFPLPENAAVHEFVMTVGTRRIRGLIREREEARRTYLEARRQGYVASLLTQERPNVFTQRVANLEPGRAIDIEIRYLNTLSYLDGDFEFRFPMVVAPRYNPPGSSDGIAAVSRDSWGAFGPRDEVPYLRPGESTGHDVDLTVDLRAGLPLQAIDSPSHAVDVHGRTQEGAQVRLADGPVVADRDFVLRWSVADERVQAALLRDGSEAGHLALMLMPPEDLWRLPRRAIELTLVVDRSGSMKGTSLDLAAEAVESALDRLGPDDRFNVVDFANGARAFERRPVDATRRNVDRARHYVRNLEAAGGTELAGAVERALEGRRDGYGEGPFRCVAFLTDGQVGNEAEVLELLADRLGDARVFSFAVGSASNQFLAERMARFGRGAVAFLGHGDDPRRVMGAFLERVSRPALTDLQLDWGGADVADVYPRRIPDLYAGRPVIVSARFRGSLDRLRLSGWVDGRKVSIPIDLSRADGSSPALGVVWARRKLAELTDRLLIAGGDPSWNERQEIQDLALRYGLLSDYTAFLAVDSSRRVEGQQGVTTPVPVHVPHGQSYHTTVGGR